MARMRSLCYNEETTAAAGLFCRLTKEDVFMRRKDREIFSRAEMLAVLDRCPVLHLALNAEESPYVVPLSFGWEERGGAVCLYVHGAMEGRRHDLLAADGRVTVLADVFHQYIETANGVSCVYESVIGTGRAEIITGMAAVNGMACILRHCGYPGRKIPPEAFRQTSLWRITLDAMTGKRRRP